MPPKKKKTATTKRRTTTTAGPAAAEPVVQRFVYLIEKPGSDLDGEDTIIRAGTREEADEQAAVRVRAWQCKALRYIGRRVGSRYVFDVPKRQLPPWAREVVNADAAAKKEK